MDRHHLIPKLKGGRQTVVLHRICHRQIHALFSEAQLARDFYTIDLLLQNETLSRFAAWVKNKPDNFLERTRSSNDRSGKRRRK
jgi:hypothetical protein